jgi:hypothetical protein
MTSTFVRRLENVATFLPFKSMPGELSEYVDMKERRQATDRSQAVTESKRQMLGFTHLMREKEGQAVGDRRRQARG